MTKREFLRVVLIMEQIRISCKNLGDLALPTFCPRCFWISMHCESWPFAFFPGIFSSIDSYSKKITNLHFHKHKRPPKWFKGFGTLGKPIPVPHHTKFNIIDKETNIKLTGVPDEILQRTNGSHFIVDYKTARFTAHQDELMPIYRVQLNGYAYIAERIGFKPVSGIGLLYYEPFTDISHQDIDEYVLENGFSMNFSAHLLELKLNTRMIKPLLRELRKLLDKPKAPKGIKDCGDCEAIEQLTNLWLKACK